MIAGLALMGLVMLFVIQRLQQAEQIGLFYATLSEEQARFKDQLLKSSEGIRSIAFNMTRRDELAAFVRRPEPEWAKQNITAALEQFQIRDAWVLDARFNVRYSSAGQTGQQEPLPLNAAELSKLTSHNWFPQFYAAQKPGVSEYFMAPIQPTNDSRRETTPEGWLLVGRKLSKEYLDVLARESAAEISLEQTAGTDLPLQRQNDRIAFYQSLEDWRGKSAARIFYQKTPQIFKQTESDRRLLFAFLSFYLMFMVFLSAAALLAWVEKPIRVIARSLDGSGKEELGRLSASRSEFGHIAGLILNFFEARNRLHDQMEKTSQLSQKLQQMLREREELGRELHDGVIQSIYAVGLNLESCRSRLKTAPARQRRQLSQAVSDINRIIRDCRVFLAGLQVDHLSGHELGEVIQQLVRRFASGMEGDVKVELQDRALSGISQHQAIHLLRILAEAMSNIRQHAEAGQVRITLGIENERNFLKIEDDGRGFDVSEKPGKGHGLNNIRSRARDMEADLRIQATPKSGTSILLLLPEAKNQADQNEEN